MPHSNLHVWQQGKYTLSYLGTSGTIALHASDRPTRCLETPTNAPMTSPSILLVKWTQWSTVIGGTRFASMSNMKLVSDIIAFIYPFRMFHGWIDRSWHSRETSIQSRSMNTSGKVWIIRICHHEERKKLMYNNTNTCLHQHIDANHFNLWFFFPSLNDNQFLALE